MGKKYIKKYFVWTDEMDKIANKLNTFDTILNFKIENEWQINSWLKIKKI